jgi:hypothetical protein
MNITNKETEIETYPDRLHLCGNDVLMLHDRSDTMKHYGKRYIIPNWDGKGNHQMYYCQSDGTWVDTFNECERSQEWIDSHVAKYVHEAPENVSLMDFLNALP